MTQFDPERHGFVSLCDFRIAGGVSVFEYRSHTAVDGSHDFLRINSYLSRDGDFVCIWNGLLDVAIAESLLDEALPPEFDLNGTYTVDLFRGYIDTDETAAVILKSLRVDGAEYSPPQVLVASLSGLRCEVLAAASA